MKPFQTPSLETRLSTTPSQVSTLQSADVTGGSFNLSGQDLGLTLNRGVGNISIPSVTLPQSSGANSVNVSLSGSTLTVNVDGHRDSVDISSAIQNREFSISFANKGYSDGAMIGRISRAASTTSNLYEWNRSTVSKIECPFGTSQAYISSFNSASSIDFSSLSRGNSGQVGVRITSINDVSENIVISGSGSGTVRIYGYFYVFTGSSGGYIYTTSSKPYLELIIEDGSLSSVSSNLYCMSGYSSLSLNDIESVTLQ